MVFWLCDFVVISLCGRGVYRCVVLWFDGYVVMCLCRVGVWLCSYVVMGFFSYVVM